MNWLSVFEQFRNLNDLREAAWANFHHASLASDDTSVINAYEDMAKMLDSATLDFRDVIWRMNPDLSIKYLLGD